jgi:hypothetical protein
LDGFFYLYKKIAMAEQKFFNIVNIQRHIRLVQQEVIKNSDKLEETENLEVGEILQIMDRQIRLGQAFGWLLNLEKTYIAANEKKSLIVPPPVA